MTEDKIQKKFMSENFQKDEGQYEYSDFNNPTFQIVSTVAFLIGVDEGNFREEGIAGLKQEIFDNLKKNQNARIIRNLCIIRTCIEKNYMIIQNLFYYEVKNISSVPDYIPPEIVMQLYKDGLTLQKPKPEVNEYIFTINKELAERIGSVKELFPDWVKWDYIKELFIMPNGQKLQGIKDAGYEYNGNRQKYPFHCYINWHFGDNGNILYCDEKFVTLLYESHEDFFEDKSLVTDAGAITKRNIYDFLARNNKAIVVVDCENSDPVKLAATLSSLSAASRAKIVKVLLFDSNYTTSAWKILSKAGDFPIEHITVERLNEKKSQVDMALATQTCKEVYSNGVDSVVLVSSDSDYWALIKTLSDIHFLVMVEDQKCGKDIKEALISQRIFFCYIDDFCTGASYSIKTMAILEELNNRLSELVKFNARVLLDESLQKTWVSMTQKEYDAFYTKYLKTMKLTIDKDGNAGVQIEM